MSKKPYVPYTFIPRYLNRYQVTLDSVTMEFQGNSRRGVLSSVLPEEAVKLKAAGRRTAVYATSYGECSITRLGTGVRL